MRVSSSFLMTATSATFFGFPLASIEQNARELAGRCLEYSAELIDMLEISFDVLHSAGDLDGPDDTGTCVLLSSS